MRIHSRKLPVPRRRYNPSDIFSELGLRQEAWDVNVFLTFDEIERVKNSQYRYSCHTGTGSYCTQWLGKQLLWLSMLSEEMR